MAGGSQEADTSADVPESVEDASPAAAAVAPSLDFEVAYVALAFAAAVIFFGIFPSPLFHFAAHAGHALAGLF
jgi:hypothetical protein